MSDEISDRRTCGDAGGITKAGKPCGGYRKLDDDGRCRHHPIAGVDEDRATIKHTRALENEERCLDLRRSGMSLRQIGKATGLHHSSVAAALKRAIARHRELTAETVQEVLELELQRLDEMQMRVWPQILSGSGVDQNRAIASVLRIMDRRASLLGLDKMQIEFAGQINSQVDFNVSVTGVDLQSMTEEDLATLELLLRKYGERDRAPDVIDVEKPPQLESTG